MNAVEIEEAVSALVEVPFDPDEFPFAFLAAFGNKVTTVQRLRKGDTNKSDIPGGVLQRSNIHMAVCAPGKVTETLKALVDSPMTVSQKAKFALATDGQTIEAENLTSDGDGETLACEYAELADHFGFFLALAGITAVKQIRENAFDIKATGRMNRLYVELLKTNPDWDTAERRQDMNHFFARLIFCFFAEDTGIFHGQGLFTNTIEQMSDATNVHQIMAEIFRAMNTKTDDRKSSGLRPWADQFPYANGGLFSGSNEVPVFSKIARSYLIHIGNLDWQRINPDIFGSMIQAVAEDEERGALGMHYTSVPNILKVLNPLFLDDLRAKLEEAGDNSRKLLNLRNRIARIRVFDPACGSGNFLVIAYKEMRAIEAQINERRRESDRETNIPLTNFRGIELRHFAAEIARLALIIAEYQCDVLYRGQRLALAEFLPLDADNWITCGNALRLNWLKICPPTGTGVKIHADDLFSTPLDQAEIDFENQGGETYICGNPPYQGSVSQTASQKEDMREVFFSVLKRYKDLDYVAAFMLQASRFNQITGTYSAFVTTNSITQGEQVAMLWPLIFDNGNRIRFAHTSFPWSNLASNKAAVICVILGLDTAAGGKRSIYSSGVVHEVDCIGPYLVSGSEEIVVKRTRPLHTLTLMSKGNQPTDGGNLLLTQDECVKIAGKHPEAACLIRRYVGSQEFIHSSLRYCLWIPDQLLDVAVGVPQLRERIERVRKLRNRSKGKQANQHADSPHRFVYAPHTDEMSIIVPRHFSAKRRYLTVGLTSGDSQVIADSASAIYGASLLDFSILSSQLHMSWVDTVAGRLKSDYRYSGTLVWNTFPLPSLTEQNQADLTRCAEDILLARESYWPATIADMYNPDRMDTEFPELRAAHVRNDETLERIYIGRRFKNDTERLEKLFDMYTKITGAQDAASKAKESAKQKPRRTGR